MKWLTLFKVDSTHSACVLGVKLPNLSSQYWRTLSLSKSGTILSESRKYGIALSLAHQNLSQIPQKLLSSILGNTICQMIFRTSREDTEVLAKEIFDIDMDDMEWQRENGETQLNLPERWEENFNNLTNLKKRQAYVVKKGEIGTDFITTLDTETYETSDRTLRRQANWIMDPYCKSEEEIKKEQEELNKELEPKKPTYKG